MSFIEFKDVVKRYTVGEQEIYAANGVSFTIEQGEFCVIVGSSGAGKTTILNMLGGMDSCTSGTILLDGEEISAYNPRRLTQYRRFDVGFVFQFYNLVQNLTALENVELASEISREPLDPRETLRQVGLGDRMDNFPAQLSGGEQQRVSIARALAKNPKLLQDTCRQTGKTVVVITHNTALTAMADRVIRVKSGRIVSNEVNADPMPVEMIEW